MRAWRWPVGTWGGWGWRRPAACLAPGSRSRCFRRGTVSVCTVELEAMRLNLKAEVIGRQVVAVGVTGVCRDPAADGAAAGVGAAAGADAGTACAGAAGPAPLPPQPQSGPRAPAPPRAPCRRSLLLHPPLPASAAAAFSAAGTTSHMLGSTDWCSSRCGPPSLVGGPG